MIRLLDRHKTKIKGSRTIVSFETTGGSNWKVWDRFIAIERKHAYHIGNICGTCEFFFERLDGANQTVKPKEAIEHLNNGLTFIDPKTLDKISEIIPNGKYEVLLLETRPRLIQPSSKEDYFMSDQRDLWQIDGFWGLPHYPKVKYYRGIDQEIGDERKIFEFINPLVPTSWLESDRIEYYRQRLRVGHKPTAIALSVLDIKQPADWPENLNPNITEHWCLAHYLLDGHHKVFAASETNQPMTILTFLATDKGVSSKDNIKMLIEKLKNTVPDSY